MRHSRCLARAGRLLGAAWFASLVLAGPAGAQEGLLGIFVDRDATNCNAVVPTAGSATLYVVFQPEGSTSGGITGAEFRIDPATAGAYILQGEQKDEADALLVGSAFGQGANVAFTNCHGGRAVPLLKFQILNPGGGGADVELRISARQPPSSPLFPCPLVTLCDSPVYTMVCVSPGKAIVNPTQPRACGPTRESAAWGRVKELYR